MCESAGAREVIGKLRKESENNGGIGWRAFDDHGAHGEKGNAGCVVFFIVIVVVAIIGKISGC